MRYFPKVAAPCYLKNFLFVKLSKSIFLETIPGDSSVTTGFSSKAVSLIGVIILYGFITLTSIPSSAHSSEIVFAKFTISAFATFIHPM
jgi:hypothetical protein